MVAMSIEAILSFILLLLKLVASTDNFIFNGFSGANLSLDGFASIQPNGLLQLTNTTLERKGHAFHPIPLDFRNLSTSNDQRATNSFSTTFVFAIVSDIVGFGGHGIAFILSPTKDFSSALATSYLGLFNVDNNGNANNHIVAIELDTVESPEFQDIDGNHVGIDINSLHSNFSHTAGYYSDTTRSFNNITLISQPRQVWVEYDGVSMQLNVTLSPVNMPKPQQPLLSSTVNLSSFIKDLMYIGFSSSTGGFPTSHYVLGWSFKMNGIAEPIDISKLPRLPQISDRGTTSKVLPITLPLVGAVLLLLGAGAIILVTRRRMFAELLEDWEREYGPHRFSYKDLFIATKGFQEKELLGIGGFGRVYKGVLPSSKLEVAVKRVSHESRQGMREFVAEIVSIGQLRHRNLVQLLGYCRRKGELLIVYDYMPNGSLDKYLFDATKPSLDWVQRLRIIKGVASGLLYLHEDWEKVVIHRDIKASNILLDCNMNARLGDFGLSRLYDHGSDLHTTHMVGTIGYFAPELARTGKASPATDVYSFGIFVLEVLCGRRPIEPSIEEGMVLMDWVLKNWQNGDILNSRDARLGNEYIQSELESVMRVGLLCSHPLPIERPSMRQVMQYLDDEMPVPEPTMLMFSSFNIHGLPQNNGFDGLIRLDSSSMIAASVVSGGR